MTITRTSAVENPLEIVDISKTDKQISEKLLHAAKTQGFLLLEGHGFTQSEVDSLFQLSHDFFDLPTEEKLKYPIDESNRGYTAMGVENLEEDAVVYGKTQAQGDPKEGFNFAHLDLQTGKADHDGQIPPIFQTDENKKLVESTVVRIGL
ncbi:unnamed protein product [Ambrosiozyma monospora]|uniref:Unnamed protein product n=1 Tax=Ambrosiozyma monospora TaxID=43982 RepID=A0ACB5U567_AMBMO|nr:unnamed protein product [Ambrosiozyma monospora]